MFSRLNRRFGVAGPIAVLALIVAVAFAGVPAMADTLPGFETYEWNGIFAPAGTPRDIIERLSTELNATIREPAVAERLHTLGALTRANTPDEFASFREQQIEFFANMVRIANIRID